MIEGLHSCKPGNEPIVGQVKTFTIINNPAKGEKKAWTKIKGAPAEQGGQPYRIVSLKPTGHTDSYGNISFNIQIEPAESAPFVPGLPPPPPPPQNAVAGRQGSASAGFGTGQTPRHYLMRAANLYCLCLDAVKNVIKPHIGDVATPELYQAAVSTLFIAAHRDGMVPLMPDKPATTPPAPEPAERDEDAPF